MEREEYDYETETDFSESDLSESCETSDSYESSFVTSDESQDDDCDWLPSDSN